MWLLQEFLRDKVSLGKIPHIEIVQIFKTKYFFFLIMLRLKNTIVYDKFVVCSFTIPIWLVQAL